MQGVCTGHPRRDNLSVSPVSSQEKPRVQERKISFPDKRFTPRRHPAASSTNRENSTASRQTEREREKERRRRLPEESKKRQQHNETKKRNLFRKRHNSPPFSQQDLLLLLSPRERPAIRTRQKEVEGSQERSQRRTRRRRRVLFEVGVFFLAMSYSDLERWEPLLEHLLVGRNAAYRIHEDLYGKDPTRRRRRRRRARDRRATG